MRVVLSILSIIAFSYIVNGQNPNGDYNPYVGNGEVTPSPLWPVEANGTGVIRFEMGNTGSDPLEVYDDQYVTLTLTLSYGEPDNAAPPDAVGGSAAGFFSWSFIEDTYTAKQIASIPAGYSGAVTIAYRVTGNSAAPGMNGFNVNISPAPYQTGSNSQADDAVNSYTYTEIRDYGDAPESYGAAWHILDFVNFLGALVDGELKNQPSDKADGDDLNGENDEDGILFPEEIRQDETISIQVTVTGMGYLNGWIDWNGDGDFEDEGERIAENIPRFSGTGELLVNVPVAAVTSVPTFARFRLSTESIDNSTGGAVGGEVEDYMITILSSPNAPDAPTGLSLVSVSEQNVTMAWNASSGVYGIEGYKVFRDHSLVGETAELTYTDSTVKPGASYIYSVSAVDSMGFESERSDPLNVSLLSVNDFGVYQLLIKPNPSSGMFRIVLDSAYGEFVLEVVSARGDIVVQHAVEVNPQVPEITVNSDFLDTGIYTVRLYNQSRIYFGKLIIFH
jgi:hypothetical protein